MTQAAMMPITEAEAKVIDVYSQLADVYDDRYADQNCPECHVENAAVWGIVTGGRGAPAQSLLDLGAGTGLALDTGMVNPELSHYRAIDPCSKMLRRLQQKHGGIPQSEIFHMTAEAYLALHSDTRFDTVVSLFGSASYIHAEAIMQLPQVTRNRLVLMHYREGYFPDYYTEETRPVTADASREAAAELSEIYGGVVVRLNNFDITVIERH